MLPADNVATIAVIDAPASESGVAAPDNPTCTELAEPSVQNVEFNRPEAVMDEPVQSPEMALEALVLNAAPEEISPEIAPDARNFTDADPIVPTGEGVEPDREESRPPDAATPPFIEITIDPKVLGGSINGRFDTRIQGCVRSAQPMEEVVLLADDLELGRIRYGLQNRGQAVTQPNGVEVRQVAFCFSLPRLRDRAAGLNRCRIVAHTVEDEYREASFEIAIDPDGATPVEIVSGPIEAMGEHLTDRTPAFCYVERAACDGNGALLLYGWAISLTPAITIQVFADDVRIGAAKLGGEREDVAAAFPDYPNSRTAGFTLGMQLTEADRTASHLRVETICLRGVSHAVLIPLEQVASLDARAVEAAPAAVASTQPAPSSDVSFLGQQPTYWLQTDFRISHTPLSPLVLLSPLGAPPEAAPASKTRRDIYMFCDVAVLEPDGRLAVSGWAVSAAGVVRVAIMLDDNLVGIAELGHERGDVGDEYAAIPSARLSGFQFDRKVVQRIQGEHTIAIVVHNSLNDEKSHTIDVAVPFVAPPPDPEPATSTDSQEFRFELDGPSVNNGIVVEPITGRLTIEGWVLARSGVAGMDVHLDGQRLGEAHYGLARQDVGQAFPDWDNALRSGFAFHCPPRSLKDGAHVVRITVRAKNGETYVRSFGIVVKKAEDAEDVASIRRRMPWVEANVFGDVLDDLRFHPSFRLVLRQAGAIDISRLTATFDTLRSQVYTGWSLRILVENPDDATELGPIVDRSASDLRDRIEIVSGLDAAWLAPLAQTAENNVPILYGFLTPGDQLGCDALAELAVAGGLHPDADFIYGDEARISPASRERDAFFKPDFSPDLLLSTNYIGRPWVVRQEPFAAAGATPASLTAYGEYDLVLRCAEAARFVHHVPKLLCRRSDLEIDDDATAKAALGLAIVRRGIEAEVLDSRVPGSWRVRRTAPAKGKVSILIPTCAAKGYIETCINTLRAHTDYADYEIIVIDNIPADQPRWKAWIRTHADRVVDIPDAFNWSRFNNHAAAEADGEYLLFLNDDIEFEQSNWLDVLLEHASRPEVGIVGPQLLYPDRKVQHAGMFLANNGIGRHAFRFAAEDEPGYFGLALTQRNVIAVTGACMLVRREVFETLGRFDEAHQIVNNDLDFCLRAHRAGLLTVFTPYATLIHHELASRDRLKDVFDLSHFNAQWKSLFTAGDPYFNPRLSRHADDYRPDDEPVRAIFAGHPLFGVGEIQRILVVKLDHIGDFVIGLPAIRRLKTLFPNATLTVLAGQASRAFAEAEPAIDAFIRFDFFHARSQLGERELTRADYDALLAELAPHRFDLAVDLRKHLSTRDVLRFTGARYLAGFDYMGQFPFLDIALEWDGDKPLQRKRGHVADDLLALVSCIGNACDTDRTPMHTIPVPIDLPDAIRLLFEKPVVAVHLGAGNITKQWPEGHFSALIDLLTERADVNIILVGGPDEAHLAATVMQNLQHPEAVGSMVGQTSLAALPRLLAACALYIGNDSGPKHIAAALGLSTIGIHSGVVDATEWGPVGRRAVALSRNMTCSPCYLAKAEDCPRAMACLNLLEPSLVFETAEKLIARPRIARPSLRTVSPIEAKTVEAETSAPTVKARARGRPVRESAK